MVALWSALVKVLFALHVHEIEFVNQSMSLQKFKSPIHRNAINSGVKFAGPSQNLSSVHMQLRGFHHAQNRPALVGEAKAAGGEFGLKVSGNLGLGKWHTGPAE